MNSFLFYTFVFIGQTLVHIATHRGGGNRGHLVLALHARLYIKTHKMGRKNRLQRETTPDYEGV